MSQNFFAKILVSLIAVAAITASGSLVYFSLSKTPISINLPLVHVNKPGGSSNGQPLSPTETSIMMAKFTSDQDFVAYLDASTDLNSIGLGLAAPVVRTAPSQATGLDVGLEYGTYTGLGAGGTKTTPHAAPLPERISETNVQVRGIDEPDILKTDGKHVYYSQEARYYYAKPMIIEEGVSDIMPAPDYQGKTQVIQAFPPDELAKIGNIDKRGDLLLQDNILMIFDYNQVYGYDISDPAKPKEKWTLKFDERNSLVQTRLYQGKVYIITQQWINRYEPCPLRPLTINDRQITVLCSDIYHPVTPTAVDVTYTIFALNPNTGNAESQVSFVGSGGNSTVYMSPNAIYTTYSFVPDQLVFIYNFFDQKMRDLIPGQIMDKLNKLMSYDLSNQSKMAELSVILEEFYVSMSRDDELKFNNEIQNRLDDYLEQHARELEQTGIVKINLSDFKIAATGKVPGRPLNQFSLDEYQNHLRIATTISGSNAWIGSGQSFSDVYILDTDLKVTSSVNDLGKGERIYSVRFIEDKGYVVTFRQIDPFYVLDLADPANAELKGELKIPGYSSYLHPINKDKILGIGQEDGQVKVSLFDVTDPAKPQEAAKYVLDEYWTEISNNHHAFLLDPKHQVFFLPASGGGYVFSYQNDQLKLERAVSDIQAKRAIYLNDYFYIVGEDKIVVLNESDWQRVNSLDLQ